MSKPGDKIDRKSSDSGAQAPVDKPGITLTPVFDSEWLKVTPNTGRNTALFSDMLSLDLDDASLSSDIGPDETISSASTVFDAKEPGKPDSGRLQKLAEESPDRYRVRKELGRGGMAVVVDAIDTDLRRHVAMKVLRDPHKKPTGGADERTPLQRFVEEAQITGQLEHPNIVPVHDIGTDSEGRIYFTMKRVEGQSLRDILDAMRDGEEKPLARFGVYEFCEIFIKVCDAMSFAHSKRVIHRDLKPDNIMVGRFGEVQVMDWGLAKIMGRKDVPSTTTDTISDVVYTTPGESQHTVEGTISGTPAYMSPEQAHGRISEINERTDVFALGALLYELITFIPPFHAKSSRDALRRAQKYQLLPPKEAVEDLEKHETLPDGSPVCRAAIERAKRFPKELAAIALKALSQNAAERYPSVEELARDVERFIKREPVKAYDEPMYKRLLKWAGRHRVISTTAASVLLVGLISTSVIAVFYADKSASDLAAASARAEQIKNELAAKDAITNEQALRLEAEKDARLKEQLLNDQVRLEKERQAQRLHATAVLGEASDLLLRAKDMLANASSEDDHASIAQTLNKALDICSETIAIDPEFERAYIERGYIEMELGFYDAALADFRHGNDLLAATDEDGQSDASKGDPNSLLAAAMLELTVAFLIDDDATGPIHLGRMYRYLEKAFAASGNGTIIHELSKALLQGRDIANQNSPMSERTRALDVLRKTLASLQNDTQQLWEVHFFSGFFTVLNANPKTGQFMLDRISDKEMEQVEKSFRRAVALRPHIPLCTHFTSLFSAYKYYQDRRGILGKTEREYMLNRLVIDQWDAFITKFPNDPVGYYARAIAPRYLQQTLRLAGTMSSRLPAATEKDLAKALELNPDFGAARRALAEHLEGQRRFDEAIASHALTFDRWDPHTEREVLSLQELAKGSRQWFDGFKTSLCDYLRLLAERGDGQALLEAFETIAWRIDEAERERGGGFDTIPVTFADLKAYYFKETLRYLDWQGNLEFTREFLDTVTLSPATVQADIAAGAARTRIGDFDEGARLLKRASDAAQGDHEELLGEIDRTIRMNESLNLYITNPERKLASGDQQYALDLHRLRSAIDQTEGRDYTQLVEYLAVVRNEAEKAIPRVSHDEMVQLIMYLVELWRGGLSNQNETNKVMESALRNLLLKRPFRYQLLKNDSRVLDALKDFPLKVFDRIENGLS
ncbi:MAG: serine/threonine protein kinase [Planctomycetaceae bacterium]|nr:serine/threonine protein kinase [Planctomycetaceae bacterium]